MQGPHHVAQKSMTMTLPASSALVMVLVLAGPSSTVRVNSGAGFPSKAMTLGTLGFRQRIDLRIVLGSCVYECKVLWKLGGDAPAFQPNCSIAICWPFGSPRENFSGSTFISIDEIRLEVGSTETTKPFVLCRTRS